MTTYYIDSQSGNDASDGSTKSKAWRTTAYAFSAMKGGDTLIFESGTYPPYSVPRRLAGTATQPTVLRAATKWCACVRGGSPHGIVINDAANYVIIDGFQAIGAPGDGLKTYSSYAVIRNCWSHHNCRQGIAMHNYDRETPPYPQGGTIDRCLVEYNGTHPTQEHGIYVSGDDMRISNCIVRHNSGSGIQLYSGFSNPSFSNSYVYNNLIHDHSQHPNSCGIYIRSANNGGNNHIINNTIIITRSYALVYSNFADALSVGASDIIANNILIGGMNYLTTFTQRGEASALALPWDDTDKTMTPKPPASAKFTHNLLFPYDYPTVFPNNLLITDYADLRTLFIDAEGGVFWLVKNPLATAKVLGTGTDIYFSTSELKLDFWGRTRLSGLPDLGAFPFVEEFTQVDIKNNSVYRASWFGKRWPYLFSDGRGIGNMPDLWIAPPAIPVPISGV